MACEGKVGDEGKSGHCGWLRFLEKRAWDGRCFAKIMQVSYA